MNETNRATEPGVKVEEDIEENARLSFNLLDFGFYDEEQGFSIQNHWVYHFIDIIYVATIYNINHLFTYCGESVSVYTICSAYFFIMFMSRYMFDVYTSIFKATGTLHTIVFVFYGISVFCMTLNITARPAPFGETSDYGTCTKVNEYDSGFAAGFLFSRLLIFALYMLYYFIFHESNMQDMYIKKTKTLRSQRSSDRSLSLSSSVQDSPSKPVRKEMNGLREISTDSTSNYSTSKLETNHMLRIFLWKLSPIVLSSVTMTLTFIGWSPVYIFPVAAAIEAIGVFLPECCVDLRDLSPNRHHLLERMGLLFMLMLGEAVLGLLIENVNVDRAESSYGTLFSSFVLVITLGYQYFENTQAEHANEGFHPMDIPGLNSFFIFTNVILSFFALVMSNAMVQIYYAVAGVGTRQTPDETREQIFKLSISLYVIWLLILTLQLCDKDQRDKILGPLKKFLLQVGKNDDEESSLSNSQDLPKTVVTIVETESLLDVFFNKRLFALKFIVAHIHLISFRFRMPPKYFILMNALFALFPSLVEIVIGIIDLRIKMSKFQNDRRKSLDDKLEMVESPISNSVKNEEN